MEKEIRVPLNLTIKLKELGFNPNNYLGKWYQFVEKELYNPRRDEYVTVNKGNPIKLDYSNSVSEEDRGIFLAYALVWDQVFDWFREEHHIIGNVYCNGSGYEWECHYDNTRGGTSIKMSCGDGDCEFSGTYITYEKAREDLIKDMISRIKL